MRKKCLESLSECGAELHRDGVGSTVAGAGFRRRERRVVGRPPARAWGSALTFQPDSEQ